MAERQLRIGFIGCGLHASMNLYPSLQYAPIHLVSVCDLDEGRRKKVTQCFGAEADFKRVSELLKGPEIEAMFICGPPDLHRAAATQALDAGLPGCSALRGSVR